MFRQLSVYAENAKGTMRRITGILADAGINMNTLITNDSAEFGIIRALVSDADLAAEVLTGQGFMCRVENVLAVEISDESGSLHKLLTVMEEGNINIDYLYVTYSCLSKLPVAIMRTPDLWEVEDFLTSRGYDQVEKITENP